MIFMDVLICRVVRVVSLSCDFSPLFLFGFILGFFYVSYLVGLVLARLYTSFD